MQCRPGDQIRRRGPVEAVRQDRETERGGMRPDLMRATGLRRGGQEGMREVALLEVETGERRDPALRVHSGAMAVSNIRPQGQLGTLFLPGGEAAYQGMVGFGDLVAFKKEAHRAVSACIAG